MLCVLVVAGIKLRDSTLCHWFLAGLDFVVEKYSARNESLETIFKHRTGAEMIRPEVVPVILKIT